MPTKTLGVAVTANTTGLQAGLGAAARQVRTFAYEVGVASQSIVNRSTLAQGGIAALGVATVLALKETVGAAIGFEVEMRNVNSIMKQTEEQFAETSAQVLGLSQQLPQDAQTLARGLYDIASSGFQGAEGLNVLEASARAATAGMTTTDVAARGITAVLNAYGLSAKDAADVSDVLFQTVNLGVVTFEELASQLGDVVGIAAAAGVAIDEVGAAIAAMTLSGISAAESTTSLNRVLQTLLDPGDALKAVLRSIGIESAAAALAQDGLYDVMQRLKGAVGGNVQTLLALFPEIRAARGAFALLAADGENYRKTQEGITDEQKRAQATQKAFNEQMKATGNQLKLAVNDAKAFGIEIGAEALPAVRELVGGLGFLVDVLRVAGGFLIEHRELIIAIGIAYATRLSAAVILRVVDALLNMVAAMRDGLIAARALSTALNGLLTAGVVLGIQGIVEQFTAMDEAAASAAAELKNFPIEPFDELTDKLEEDVELYNKLKAAAEDVGVWQKLWEALPFTRNRHAELVNGANALRDAIELADQRAANFGQNASAVARELGLRFTPELSKQIAKVADSLDVDLEDPFADSAESRQKVIDDFHDMADSMDLTIAQLDALGPEMIEQMQAAEEAARAAAEQFAETFGLLNDFDLPSADEAADRAEEAIDRLRDAEERLADARQRAEDAARYITMTPERQRELAKAQRDVADAERDVAKAREEANEAALTPDERIREQYDKQIAAAEQFLRDFEAVAKMDIPPEFLARALADPEAFGPILAAIARDTSGGLAKVVKDSEEHLKSLGTRIQEIAELVGIGVREEMDRMSEELLTGLRKALTDPIDEVSTLAFQIGAAIKENIDRGLTASGEPITLFGPSVGDLVLANTLGRATGGIDAHVAHSRTYMYAEPGTGGEAFIPLGPGHRGRSTVLLGQVAHMFGYGLIPMQHGGIVGGGGGGGGVVNNYSKRGGDIHVAEVRAHDYMDFKRQMAREERLRSLTGGP